MHRRPVLSTIFAALAVVAACTASQEAVQVQLDVQLDASGISPTTNDAGWAVELTTARIAASDLQFTILGEMHGATASLGGRLSDWLLARAWAHPGHYAGGDVTGELAGDFIFDWLGHDGMKLGAADMLIGDYNGLNFTFRAATAADGLEATDPLLGHAVHFVGVARKAGQEVGFTAVLDLAAGTQVVGAPFEDTVDAASVDPIEFQFLPRDPIEGKSLFDGLDFAALDDDADGSVSIGPGDEAHNILRRTLQSHVHYNASPR